MGGGNAKSPGALLLRGFVWFRLVAVAPAQTGSFYALANECADFTTSNGAFQAFHKRFCNIVRPASTKSASPCLLTASARAMPAGLPQWT